MSIEIDQTSLKAFELAGLLNLPERHHVIFPGTPVFPEESVSLLADAIRDSEEVSVYTGVNLCPFICKFCRYGNQVVSPQRIDEQVSLLLSEIDLINPQLPEKPISSIYIGGGTPALIGNDRLRRILERFPIDSKTEVSIETTPELVTASQLEDLAGAGITRVSFGVQRLNDVWLASVGRKHTRADALKSIETCLGSGLRFNVDLMYGFADQTSIELNRDLKDVVALMPPEITLYRLETEKRTDDAAIKIDRATTLQCYQLKAAAGAFLTEHGYIEGPDGWFTQEGLQPAQVYQDRWNRQIPMKSFGPEAYSFSTAQQYTNLPFSRWKASIEQSKLPIDPTRSFKYTEREANCRFMAFRLRSTFSTPILCHAELFDRLQSNDFGSIDNNTFTLSKMGVLGIQEIVRALIDT
jgi:coproporphyrinogen III oxidase-like Fe-S oxidoreductase